MYEIDAYPDRNCAHRHPAFPLWLQLISDLLRRAKYRDEWLLSAVDVSNERLAQLIENSDPKHADLIEEVVGQSLLITYSEPSPGPFERYVHMIAKRHLLELELVGSDEIAFVRLLVFEPEDEIARYPLVPFGNDLRTMLDYLSVGQPVRRVELE